MVMRSRVLSSLVVGLCLSLLGCPEETTSTNPGGDIAQDVTAETAGDAVGSDVAADATTDAAPDASPADTSPDAPTIDAATDSAVADADGSVADVPVTDADAAGDAPAPDATPDAVADAGQELPQAGDGGGTSDAEADATPDAVSDATPDSVADAVADAASDATPDAAPDAAADATADVAPPVNGCPPYHKFCDGACINVAVDPDNCGDCGEVCTGNQVCSGGTCTNSCPPGLTACDNTCVDTNTDSQYCGDCPGETCPDGQGCVNGNCEPKLDLGDPPAQCAGFESPLVVNDGSSDTCLGDQAQIEFTWGLCSCAGINATNVVFTDAYDSLAGPYEPGGIGGGIGANGAVATSNVVTVGGSLFTSAAGGYAATNEVDILGELHSGGNVSTNSDMNVGFDAFVDGDISGNIDIGGTLHTAGNVSGGVTYGALDTTAATVDPPCRCDEQVPVGTIVSNYQVNNDNALINLQPDALINPPGKLYVELPCGIYYLDGITTNSELTIVATGRVALMIGGNVSLSNSFQMLPAPGAELDVFVAGQFTASGEMALGSPAYPALMRVYLGSSTGLNLSNNTDIGAFLYAAAGPVTLSNKFDMFGGLIAGSLSASNEVTIHYDRAVLQAGTDCPDDPPAGGCNSCADCGNQACIGGECTACVTSADCCAPLICAGGECISLSVQ